MTRSSPSAPMARATSQSPPTSPPRSRNPVCLSPWCSAPSPERRTSSSGSPRLMKPPQSAASPLPPSAHCRRNRVELRPKCESHQLEVCSVCLLHLLLVIPAHEFGSSVAAQSPAPGPISHSCCRAIGGEVSATAISSDASDLVLDLHVLVGWERTHPHVGDRMLGDARADAH